MKIRLSVSGLKQQDRPGACRSGHNARGAESLGDAEKAQQCRKYFLRYGTSTGTLLGLLSVLQ